MMQKLLTTLLMVCSGVPGAAWAQTGQINMSSTGYPDSVVIDLTITDGGGSPLCGWLGVTRGYGGDVIALIERMPGTTITRRVVDTNLSPNTIYCYRVALLQFPVPAPLWCGGDVMSVCQVFNCFYDIQTCSNTGPDPAFLGHGHLTSEGAIPNEVAAFLHSCASATSPLAFYSVSGTAQQYVDSGIAVDVYGTMERGGIPQGIWYVVAQAATPHACVVAIEQKTWGAVKMLYRN